MNSIQLYFCAQIISPNFTFQNHINMFKKILRISLYLLLTIIGILLVSFVALKVIYNEDVPHGETGKVADELAYQMLEAIHHKEFTQTTEIRWTFRGVNRYEWKLQEDVVEVYWKDHQVTLHTKSPEESEAYQNNKPIEGEKREEAIAYATKNFNNDSFWLVAPHKVFDEGTQRQLIEEDNKQHLLVTYTSGGSTPGDSYLWELDENKMPIAMKMWVSIIPFDGVEAKWVDWQMTEGGFPLPQQRKFFGIKIPISEVEVLR
jgi:nicotinamide mononucleotide adenylyltransferase